MEHLKKSSGHLLEETKVIYGFIWDHSDELPVRKMCQVLNVSRLGYYDWLKRKPNNRQKINDRLKKNYN